MGENYKGLELNERGMLVVADIYSKAYSTNAEFVKIPVTISN